jgi:hypothetical protein
MEQAEKADDPAAAADAQPAAESSPVKDDEGNEVSGKDVKASNLQAAVRLVYLLGGEWRCS